MQRYFKEKKNSKSGTKKGRKGVYIDTEGLFIDGKFHKYPLECIHKNDWH